MDPESGRRRSVSSLNFQQRRRSRAVSGASADGLADALGGAMGGALQKTVSGGGGIGGVGDGGGSPTGTPGGLNVRENRILKDLERKIGNPVGTRIWCRITQ